MARNLSATCRRRWRFDLYRHCPDHGRMYENACRACLDALDTLCGSLPMSRKDDIMHDCARKLSQSIAPLEGGGVCNDKHDPILQNAIEALRRRATSRQ